MNQRTPAMRLQTARRRHGGGTPRASDSLDHLSTGSPDHVSDLTRTTAPGGSPPPAPPVVSAARADGRMPSARPIEAPPLPPPAPRAPAVDGHPRQGAAVPEPPAASPSPPPPLASPGGSSGVDGGGAPKRAKAAKPAKIAKPPPSGYHAAIDAFHQEHIAILGTEYPWIFVGRDADGGRVKTWLAAARVAVDDPAPGIARIRGAARAYLRAVEAKTAFPTGPPSTHHFTRELARWLATDPDAAPVRPGKPAAPDPLAVYLEWNKNAQRQSAERVDGAPAREPVSQRTAVA